MSNATTWLMSTKSKRREEAKGEAEQVEGKVREGVGKITGSEKEKLKGKAKQVKGKVREELAEHTD